MASFKLERASFVLFEQAPPLASARWMWRWSLVSVGRFSLPQRLLQSTPPRRGCPSSRRTRCLPGSQLGVSHHLANGIAAILSVTVPLCHLLEPRGGPFEKFRAFDRWFDKK